MESRSKSPYYEGLEVEYNSRELDTASARGPQEPLLRSQSVANERGDGEHMCTDPPQSTARLHHPDPSSSSSSSPSSRPTPCHRSLNVVIGVLARVAHSAALCNASTTNHQHYICHHYLGDDPASRHQQSSFLGLMSVGVRPGALNKSTDESTIDTLFLAGHRAAH